MSSSFHRISCLFILCLTTWTACGDAFQTPYCDYFADRPECLGVGKDLGAMPSPDMQQGMTQPVPDMTPVRVMKDPVGFTYATFSLINSKLDWVGIHQGNRLVFAVQKNSDAEIVSYTLEPSISQGWTLIQYNQCDNCLKSVPNFNFNNDYLVSSRSLFYRITPGTPGSSGFIADQTLYDYRYISMNKSIAGYRPYTHTDFDGLIFQLGENDNYNTMSGSALFYQRSPSTRSTSVSYDRVNVGNDKYLTYCAGDLDQLGTTLPQQEVLTFEESAVKNAFHIRVDQSGIASMEKDDNLKSLVSSLRDKIYNDSMLDSKAIIRSAYIADLNNDKYADLLLGILNNIYVASYKPETGEFILWASPIVTLAPNERPRSITVSDLNGDSYPDLAVEIYDRHDDYRFDSPLRVSFYINQQH